MLEKRVAYLRVLSVALVGAELSSTLEVLLAGLMTK